MLLPQEKGRNKCVIYWPETVGTYGDYTVTVRDSTQYEGFTVTSMLLTDGEVSLLGGRGKMRTEGHEAGCGQRRGGEIDGGEGSDG